MRLGVVFPQTELAGDVAAGRQFVQTAEELGFDHLRLSEHVLGVDLDRVGIIGPYSLEDPFHAPLVFMGYLAAATTSLELTTALLISPQRPTVLVAKQAAEVDVLTQGRLRLGIGVGWNPVEYEALGADFRRRGDRIEEQVGILRTLWTEKTVDLETSTHRIRHSGLRPMPVQRPIPIWMGGGQSARVLRRIGRLADGWLPPFDEPTSEFGRRWSTIQTAAREAGRGSDAVKLEGRIETPGVQPSTLRARAEAWHAAGASHLGCNTLGLGRQRLEAHLGELERVASALAGL